MRLILLFLLITTMGHAQIIDAVIPRDSTFLIRYLDITETDIEGVSDTTIRYEEVGDTAAIKNFLMTEIRTEIGDTRSAVQNLFRYRNFTPSINSLNIYFEAIHGSSVRDSLSKSLANSYLGKRYRFFAEGDSTFFADVIQLPSGALRLERRDNGTRYPLIPYTSDFFEVRNIPYLDDGTTGNFYFVYERTNSNRDHYRPLEFGIRLLNKLRIISQ